MLLRRGLLVLALGLVCATSAGCSTDPSSAAVTGDDAALTQARVERLSAPAAEAVRAAYEGSTKDAGDDFYGYAAAFSWGTEATLGDALTAEQLDFLAGKLIRGVEESRDPIARNYALRAADVTDFAGLGESLRLAGQSSAGVDAALADAAKAGLRVVRYAPKTDARELHPTAGALMLVDMQHREALVLYGRRGPAPTVIECEVTEMESYEFEESLSKDEYGRVNAMEAPLSGDTILSIGGLVDFSNAEISEVEGDLDYHVTVLWEGSEVTFEATRGTSFHAKLVASGVTGAVYGDRDGNGRPNKAASLSCKTLGSAGAK